MVIVTRPTVGGMAGRGDSDVGDCRLTLTPVRRRHRFRMTPISVHGTVTEPFTAVRDLLADHLATGAELGASITVDIDGDTVVDLWGGHRDPARTRSWDRDTITNVWSITKQVSALAVLMLADR